MKAIDFKKCHSLEKVTFGVNFDLAELYRVNITTTIKVMETNPTTEISGENTVTETEKISTSRKSMKNIGTVLALVFNPKSDIDLFKLEHLDKLEIHMRHLDWPEPLISAQTSDKIKRTLKIMKVIGEAAKNIRWLIVGGKSFYYPEIYNTGFKNFGTSLKVFTLNDGCFDVMNYNNVMTCDVVSVNTFFKSMSENCPNLSILNLGSAHQLRCVNTDNRLRDFEKLFSTAGFEMVKELNVDFTVFDE